MNKTEFKLMSDIEVAIQKIEDAKMIHIYELTGAKMKKKAEGCVAIAIAYGENQQINLSENDEGFQILVNKACQIYKDNKDLIMDETTRLFLENGATVGMEQSLEVYYQLKAAEYPVISGDSLMSERFMPVAEYVIMALHQLFDMDAKVVKREKGWRGAFLLETDIDGKSVKHYGKVVKMNDRYFAISVNNCLKNNATLLINVQIGFGKMEIRFNIDSLVIDGVFTYEFKENKLIECKEIMREDKTVYYDVKEYEAQNQNYQLPFQVEYKVIKEQSNTEEIESSSISGQYIWMNGTLVETTGWTEVLNVKKNIRIKIHSIYMQEIQLPGGKVQTYFLETDGSTSEKYRKNLERKYFIR